MRAEIEPQRLSVGKKYVNQDKSMLAQSDGFGKFYFNYWLKKLPVGCTQQLGMNCFFASFKLQMK